MEPGPLVIGAERVRTGQTIEVTSPYSGEVVGAVAKAGTEHLDAAVAAARDAMSAPLPTHQRVAVLDAVAARLTERAEDFARLIAAEAAKPLRTARAEVARGIDTLAFSAAAARTLTGEFLPLDASAAGEGKVGWVTRVPAGVVAAITPFNFPLNLVLHKLGPSLAAGCAVVLKPASSTPLTAAALVELFHDCGLPPGWLNFTPCSGSTANHLVTHPGVDVVSFTGSREVGWSIREQAPRKRVGLELGNNSPAIVEPDADWRAAARKIAAAGNSYAGQSCISTQRVYVHDEIAAAFLDELAAAVGELVVGDPLDEATDVSALIDAGETERVRAWVREAVAAGASVAAGGEQDGGVLRPTVLADVKQDMRVSREEVFGPVLAVQTYGDYDDALAMANDTDYGLQAAVFTRDLGKALRAARVLRYGGVLVNETPTWRADLMPYGGVGDSGNTREGPAYAIRELLTEQRLVVLQP
ncbi:MAG TPA: aldehyde dehydrogenase family protein [Egibacteraceae bacterium]|nr:aldehyde dehydrogenase family protein [Egibacteraceae bacterium]